MRRYPIFAPHGNQDYFEFIVDASLPNASLTGFFRSTNPLYVHWGDGSPIEIFNGNDADQNFRHTYAQAGEYRVRIFGANSMTRLRTSGVNFTYYYDIKDLPRGLYSLRVYGDPRVTGDLADLPQNLWLCFISYGNTVVGKISDIPESLKYFSVEAYYHSTGYTPGHVFNESFSTLYIHPEAGYALSSTDVDNILIDLKNSVTTAIGDKRIDLAGNNSPRTSSSDDAVNYLEGLGFTVTTN